MKTLEHKNNTNNINEVKNILINDKKEEKGNFNSLVIKEQEINIKVHNKNTTKKENKLFVFYLANSLSFNQYEKLLILKMYKSMSKINIIKIIRILKEESQSYRELSYKEYDNLSKMSRNNKKEWKKLEKNF